MRHEDFARRAADLLDEMADAAREKELCGGYGITTMRSNDTRVAAHVVRVLSESVTREEHGRRGPSSDPFGG